MLTRKELNKKACKLICDMGLRWREHFNSAPPIEFIESTALLIISEVICYQLEQIIAEKEKESC